LNHALEGPIKLQDQQERTGKGQGAKAAMSGSSSGWSAPPGRSLAQTAARSFIAPASNHRKGNLGNLNLHYSFIRDACEAGAHRERGYASRL
jgi:hypothetical protein